ncbi:MAG TPA: substrate-binding domain-containing protein [Actinomycetota bacterium]|nr:substrate-binding domain-containing protein [Actinomycetota bacterium]
MTHEPWQRRGLSRRDFLRRAGAAGIAVPSLAAILAACGGGAQETPGGGGGGGTETGGDNPYGTGGIGGAPYPLARIDAPVTWNITDDNPPIASDLEPESGGTLKIFNWNYYLSKSLMRQFGEQHGVTVELTTFDDMADGIQKITSGEVDFDLMFGVQVYTLGRLIAGGFLQPLNHDYIPNLAANVWEPFQSPFYDLESRYSMPYAVWNTGIMWRNDHVTADIAAMENPWDVFWTDAPAEKTHLLNNSRDLLSLAMYRQGQTDVNTGDPAVIRAAKDLIAEVVAATNAKLDHNDYADVPKGRAYLHQSWSGNVGSAFYFLPEGDTAPNISYYWPGSSDGIPGSVENDTVTILKTAQNPVLAHLFIDFILDTENARTNYTTYTGYQQPMKEITPESLVGSAVVPEHLVSTVVTEEDFTRGYRILELAPDVEALWESAYQEILAGV